MLQIKNISKKYKTGDLIQNALKKVDYRRLKINGNEVSFEDFETKLDLGAIAKGYCADKLKEFLV